MKYNVRKGLIQIDDLVYCVLVLRLLLRQHNV